MIVRAFLLMCAILAGVSGGGAGAQAAGPEPKATLLLASTIGPIDAGIVPALEEAYFAKTGVLVRHVGAGTGAALEMAKRGGFDLVLVHARALEDRFIAQGFGLDRRDIMYNDFVLLGPPADPAGIRGERSAEAALRKIARSQAVFVTRGDQSGTHVKELELWQQAGIQPQGPWYVTFERGATGNAPTTRYADQRQAYTLMDRATYLTLKREIGLQVLLEKDSALLNYIAVLRLNPARFPTADLAGATAFVEWLESEEAQGLIRTFGVAQYGEPLFFPNAAGGKRQAP
jgi:tungstate transport system substrate-binding protein